MMHVAFLLFYASSALLHVVLTFGRQAPRIIWTLEVRLATCCWFSLIGVSMLWPNWPHAKPALGATAFLAGRFLVSLAVRANPYFTPNLRPSPVIVKAGVYRYVKHPAYLGMALSASGVWLYFHSRPASILFLLYIAILYTRVCRERALING